MPVGKAAVAALGVAAAIGSGCYFYQNHQATSQNTKGATAMSQTQSPSAQKYPERAILNGVPKIGYGIHPCPFPGSLFAAMQYIGEPQDYDTLMAVSGGAFRRFWNRDDGGNVDLMYLSPEPYRRAFRAIGREPKAISGTDEASMIAAVKESISLGRPVLAFGIIGPPECGLVTGYDKDGETLFGYSYFQGAALPGYYEQPGWFEHMDRGSFKDGMIAIGEKTARPPEKETLISTLEYAIDLAHARIRPGRPNHLSGLAAYDGWADGLEVDADYPQDPKIMETRRMVHCDQYAMLLDRGSAAKYLRRMATEAAPEAAGDLNAAAALYEELAGMTGKVWPWGWTPEGGNAAKAALRSPQTRRELAGYVRQAKEKETRAIEHLEAAMRVLSPKSNTTSRKVLPNIHNLVTWELGQNYPFNGCMQYLMECLGESKDYDYWFFSGVTGDSFTQVHSQNYKRPVTCLSQDTFDNGFAKKAFDACGNDFTYVDEAELMANKARYVGKVIAYINKGIPVIARDCEGTKAFSVICGYEDSGETFLYLKGDDKTPTPYKSNLTGPSGRPSALVFVGAKKQAPPLADAYRKAVMSIPSYITMPPKDGLTFGKQAFENWADSFLDGRFESEAHWVNSIQDGKFESTNEAETDVWRIHGTYLCISGTNGCSRGFLQKAYELCPDMKIIPQLQPIYERMQNLFEEIQMMEGGFNIAPANFKDKAVMQPISNKIREFSKCCDEVLGVFASQKTKQP